MFQMSTFSRNTGHSPGKMASDPPLAMFQISTETVMSLDTAAEVLDAAEKGAKGLCRAPTFRTAFGPTRQIVPNTGHIVVISRSASLAKWCKGFGYEDP
jgi:hypothetical protein